MEPPEMVLSTFTAATGTEFRIPPHYVMKQAMAFAKHFSLAELQLVIAFLKRQVAIGKHNFTAAAYSWRRLFGEHGSGDEFQNFQERLGQAQDALKKGWKPPAALLVPSPADLEPEGFNVWIRGMYGDSAKPWSEIKPHLRAELLREFSQSKS